MRRAKICIVTRGERLVWGDEEAPALNLTLRKYMEAMASGCLIAGDLPDNQVQNLCSVADRGCFGEDGSGLD